MSDFTETARIAELKASLDASFRREEDTEAIARNLLARNKALEEQVKHLEQCIQKLEGDKAHRGGKQGWISRIFHILNHTGRPMRLTEILHQMQASDTEGKLQKLSSVREALSVNLCRAVESRRLKPFKVTGVRGAFYALPKWINAEGDLPQEIWNQMYWLHNRALQLCELEGLALIVGINKGC